MIGTDSDQELDPHKVAILAISLLQTMSFDALFTLSSSLLKERVMALDSHSYYDKLSLYQWNETYLHGPSRHDQTGVDEARSAVGAIEVLREVVDSIWVEGRGDEMDDGLVRYRIWDEDTVQAAVPFRLSAAFHASLAINHHNDNNCHGQESCGVVILLLDPTTLDVSSTSAQTTTTSNRWHYHDFKHTTSFSTEFSSHSLWLPTLQAAKEEYVKRIENCERTSVWAARDDSNGSSSAEEIEYWASYDNKGGSPPLSSEKLKKRLLKDELVHASTSDKKDQDDDDYWEMY